MSNVRRLVEHLDDTFAVCRSGLGETVRQLHEWSGEFSASTSGAGPAHAVGRSDVRVDADGRPVEEPVRLSKIEADALNPDEARRALVRCYQLVDLLVEDLGRVGDALGGERLPVPAERLAARLAFVQWQINKVTRASWSGGLGKEQVGRVDRSVGYVNELAGICASYRPAPKQVRPVNVCHAHEAAGLDASIDSSYRRWHLCRWCGDFRNTHGVNPPAKLVRLHDRGISMTTSLLRAAGIRPASGGRRRRGA